MLATRSPRAVGGLDGGQILQALIPAITGAAGGGIDIGSIVGQLVGGGIGWCDPHRHCRLDHEVDG
jgi:hypothetical protein